MDLNERIDAIDRDLNELTAQHERNVRERDAMLADMGLTIEQLQEVERSLHPQQRQALEDEIRKLGEELGVQHQPAKPVNKAPRVKRGIPI